MTRQRGLFSEKREKPVLRPYQEQGLVQLRTLVEQGSRRIVLVLPTGGGKTVVAARIIDLARTLAKKVLFVAHRVELINQTARQLERFGVEDIGVIRGQDDREDESAPIQIASIETLRRRERPEADIVFIDECHRAVADSYRSLFTDYPVALHIGLTATPFRLDNQGLGELYSSLVCCALPSQLVADGFIQVPRVFAAPEWPDLSGVDVVSHSDYHNGNLANVMSKPRLVGNIVEEWKKHAQGRRTVVFAVSVDHSMRIVEVFREAGVPALHIDGNTSERDRTTALLRLEKGEIRVVSNCDVLTEGWDQPSVKCAVLARPTQSLRIHLQQCGRILRPFTNDVLTDAPTSALILDHAGNVLRHGLPHQDREFDLVYGQKKKSIEQVTLHTCRVCFAMWSGNSRTCPECGGILPEKIRAEIEQDEQVRLAELSVPQVLTQADIERQFYLKELTKCRDQGKRPGAASYKFKEKYGKWPPYSWSQQANALFASSPDWQQAVDQRNCARSFWEQRMADAQQAHEPQQPKDEGFTEVLDEDDYFGQFSEVGDDDIPF